ncbi:MAG TPA: hypothetical protein VKG91_16915, partial [Roseiarcus sp.]|nr:hypothetical protein [Roseiarcus sp.]
AWAGGAVFSQPAMVTAIRAAAAIRIRALRERFPAAKDRPDEWKSLRKFAVAAPSLWFNIDIGLHGTIGRTQSRFRLRAAASKQRI